LDPTDPNYVRNLLGSVAQVYQAIVASDFPRRAQALAREIMQTHPDLVTLQEVSLLRTQWPSDHTGVLAHIRIKKPFVREDADLSPDQEHRLEEIFSVRAKCRRWSGRCSWIGLAGPTPNYEDEPIRCSLRPMRSAILPDDD